MTTDPRAPRRTSTPFPAVSPRYRWRLASKKVPKAAQELFAILLELRGVSEGHQAASFFAPPYEDSLHDSLLLPQCAAAVGRLRRALADREPIAVFGDYDVDGITSAALIADVLEGLGGRVHVELPHRNDGYGLSVDAVRRLVPGATLLVTVDNGVSATPAVTEALARGADVIILDHHAVSGALPPGALVVHPALPSSRYPNPHLSAVAVAWKVASVLLFEEGRAGQEKFLLDLVCLGTLADSVPLVGENRALVHWGLEVLRHSQRPGLHVLAEQAGFSLRDVTPQAVTFKLVPRLNAAGRLRHADLALELLRTIDRGSARRLALELESVNEERRLLTEEILLQAVRELPAELPSILFVSGPWPPGLLGILASRLAEEYQRPAIAVSVRDGECIASIRGDGVNVVDLVRETENLLTKFGGHQGAAGFSFPRSALDAIAEFFRVHSPLHTVRGEPELFIDCLLPFGLVTPDLARSLDRLEPFGNGNERPVFLFPALSVVESRAIGAKGDHTRFVFRDRGSPSGCSGVAFRWGSRPRPRIGETLDVAAELRFDQFRGVPRADLHVQDLRLSVPVAAMANHESDSLH